MKIMQPVLPEKYLKEIKEQNLEVKPKKKTKKKSKKTIKKKTIKKKVKKRK